MIVAFSTSSPIASVALFTRDGAVLASASRSAPMRASGACLEMLATLLSDSGRQLSEAEGFLADLGPGSFTGVKVAVTLAKTFAYAQGTQVGGASSFDLISASETVIFPSKRGEFFIRRPGAEAIRTEQLPSEAFVGFGPGIDPELFPLAERFSHLIAGTAWVAPEALSPLYLIEPSISQPKKPYAGAHG